MTDDLPRADNDSPWKEVLEAYFPQAMQFFGVAQSRDDFNIYEEIFPYLTTVSAYEN